MKTIWKYTLGNQLQQSIEMPEGAEVFRVASQFGQPTLWAFVDPSAAKKSRPFVILPTGASFDDEETRYIGTFETDGGAYIWHVVEPVRP